MAEAIGFAIVGLRRGFQVAKEVGQTPGARLVAVADVDAARPRSGAGREGVE